MKRLPLALLGAAVAAPAAAQPIQFSAVAESELGYVVNPLVVSGVDKGSLYASLSVAPRFFSQTSRSTTALQGRYLRETYLHGFGHTDTGSVELTRTDQLTQFLGSTLTAEYQTTNRATIGNPDIVVDPLDIGRRTRTLMGSYQLQWQATARDQIAYSAQVSHQSYGKLANGEFGTGVPSSYTQYGLNASYSHVMDARTTVGAQVALSTVRSRLYPHSRTIEPAVTAKRQLSAVWEVDGHVGMIFSQIQGPLSRSSTSLGAGINLCGAYPRTQVCLRFSRDTQPSGHGPLRKTSTAGAQLSYDLDERSRVTFLASYVKSSSQTFDLTGLTVPRSSSSVQASVDYDRDITQRISAGVGARYQSRELTDIPSGHSYAAMVHVRAKIGRM